MVLNRDLLYCHTLGRTWLSTLGNYARDCADTYMYSLILHTGKYREYPKYLPNDDEAIDLFFALRNIRLPSWLASVGRWYGQDSGIGVVNLGR